MVLCVCVCLVFFFKQKTAYEMRISDWSSDVCSSDLPELRIQPGAGSEAAAIMPDTLDALIERNTRRLTAYQNKRYAKRYTQAVEKIQIGRASCRERVCQYV